jgi:two-component system chemotaxis sensor kinase CheA
MPLVHAAGAPFATEGKQPVLVFTDDERVMGLAVDQIVDIVEEKLNVELAAARPGVLGSAVLKGRATDVLDVGYFLTECFGDWFDREATTSAKSEPRRILLVDDNAFFRNMMGPLLSAAGYDVVTAGSAEEAWRLHGEGVEIDAIVSDIEMPGQDGYTFASKVRAESRWSGAPRIALTGLPVAQAMERAPAGAFADVVRKSDRQGLIDVLSEAFKPARAA